MQAQHSSRPPIVLEPSFAFSPQWVHSLPLEQQSALAQALTPRWNKYLERMRLLRGQSDDGDWRFPSVTQHALLLTDAIEHVLFGGARGGGKSEGTLAGALQYVDVPGYSALLFRKTYQDLQQPDALVPRARQYLAGADAHWQGDLMQWRFPSGAVLKFGYLEHEADVDNYQGAAAQYWGFDEAGQLRPSAIERLTLSARRLAGFPAPIRFRYTANPGGRAHEWLVEHFVRGAPDNGRLFIPSRAVDNPGLDLADYLPRLDAISDPVLRAQMRDGDWSAVDRSQLICPEWDPETEAECTRQDNSMPGCLTAYAAADPGGHAKEAARDLFGLLWGYLDFTAGVLVVTDEWAKRNPATADVGTAAVAAERGRFGPRRERADSRYSEQVDTIVRVTDLDGRLVNDLKAPPYHLAFAHTEKTEASVWERRLRTAIRQRKICVHARCKRLLKTLKYARWNDNRTDYERTEETGHADLWKCLIYMFRAVQWQRNPYPPPGLTREERVRGERPQPASAAARVVQGGVKGIRPLK